MKLDVMVGGLPWRSMAEFARSAEHAGFGVIVVTEAGRTAYLGCGASALAADIDIITGIAVAFPRSPIAMVSGSIAWELAQVTGDASGPDSALRYVRTSPAGTALTPNLRVRRCASTSRR